MNLWRRILNHFKKKGIFKTLIIILYRISDYHFDLKYHTDTANTIPLAGLIIASANKDRGYPYQPTMTLPFNRLMDKLSLPADSVMVDFGCGKGRVLMLAALRGIKKSVGIEFSEELCNIARKNILIFEKNIGEKFDISIIKADVAHYDIEDYQNVFFLANPFDDVVLNDVVKNILKSLTKRQRDIFIIYYNPIHSCILDNFFIQKEKYIIAGEEYLLYINDRHS